MDDSLRRTLSGSLYRVKGNITIPFEIFIKALNHEDAEEIAELIVGLDDMDLDNQKVSIDEVEEQ